MLRIIQLITVRRSNRYREGLKGKFVRKVGPK